MSPEPFSVVALLWPFFFAAPRFFFFLSSSDEVVSSSSDEVLPSAEDGSSYKGVAPLCFLYPPFVFRSTESLRSLPRWLSVEVSKASADAMTSSMVSFLICKMFPSPLLTRSRTSPPLAGLRKGLLVPSSEFYRENLGTSSYSHEDSPSVLVGDYAVWLTPHCRNQARGIVGVTSSSAEPTFATHSGWYSRGCINCAPSCVVGWGISAAYHHRWSRGW